MQEKTNFFYDLQEQAKTIEVTRKEKEYLQRRVNELED